jgi:hypothetical protein
MYRTVTRNLRKRKKIAGTWYIETTTMYAPGEESMAEKTYEEAAALMEGRKRRGRHRLMFDHRWGECRDVADEPALRAALREAYGDAMEWIDEDGLVDEFYDLRSEESDSRRYFLNDRTSASDAWLTASEWAACKRPTKRLNRRDIVTLGLDGSIFDDSSALVACRVEDGHIELLALFERPEGAEAEGWQVDREAMDAAVANAMKMYQVVAFYADPPHWADYIDRWQSQWGEKMLVKASQKRALEWWTNRPTAIVAALERVHEAVLEERLTYTPADDLGEGTREAELALALTRHFLNARRRVGRQGVAIHKEAPKSPRKIDAAMAAVLAYVATCDARAAGAGKRKPVEMPRRIR